MRLVSGLSFRMASISTTMVCRVIIFTDERPSTFFRVVLVRPIKLSQKPPYHGACFGMDCQSTPCLLRIAANLCDWNNSVNSSSADRYPEALSEIIC